MCWLGWGRLRNSPGCSGGPKPQRPVAAQLSASLPAGLCPGDGAAPAPSTQAAGLSVSLSDMNR